MSDLEDFEIERLAVMICPYCGDTKRKDVSKNSFGMMVVCPACGETIIEDQEEDSDLEDYLF